METSIAENGGNVPDTILKYTTEELNEEEVQALDKTLHEVSNPNEEEEVPFKLIAPCKAASAQKETADGKAIDGTGLQKIKLHGVQDTPDNCIQKAGRNLTTDLIETDEPEDSITVQYNNNNNSNKLVELLGKEIMTTIIYYRLWRIFTIRLTKTS